MNAPNFPQRPAAAGDQGQKRPATAGDKCQKRPATAGETNFPDVDFAAIDADLARIGAALTRIRDIGLPPPRCVGLGEPATERAVVLRCASRLSEIADLLDDTRRRLAAKTPQLRMAEAMADRVRAEGNVEGGCTDEDLYRAGFTAAEIIEYADEARGLAQKILAA